MESLYIMSFVLWIVCLGLCLYTFINGIRLNSKLYETIKGHNKLVNDVESVIKALNEHTQIIAALNGKINNKPKSKNIKPKQS